MSYLLFKNQRLLLLLIGVIAVAGITSYTTMPRMEDPILVQRFGIIRTVFPGAAAERVESQISRPLEEHISTIKGIKDINSTSMAGISTVTIELKEEITDVDTVWSRVRDELSEAAKSLPEGATEPKFERPEMRSYASIIALKWNNSNPTNYAILTRLSEDLKDTVRSLYGTESVAIFGEQEEEILVEIPREVLQRTGLTIGEISTQIKNSETKGSAGIYRGKEAAMVIEVNQDFDSLQRIGATPIRHGVNQLTSLADIASIKKTIKNPPTSQSIVTGKDAIVIAAIVRDESRIDLWNDALNKKLENFKATLPPGVALDVLFTQNNYVEDRLLQLGKNLLLGTLAVVIVVFFLMGWRSMVVVGITLPLSALIVISGMKLLGVPIHQMSITGLIIALGLLIDNAIVMVDEVSQSLREGNSPKEAITGPIKHLALPLFGSTLTTTLAFTPIVILPGASGEFVGSIAISVILAINASFILAMTVVPALTALLSHSISVQSSFWNDGFSNSILLKIYRKVIITIFRFPVLGVLMGIGLPIVGFCHIRNLPEQFFPPADRDQVHIELELPASSSLEQTRLTALKVRETALSFEKVKRVDWFLGECSPAFFYNMMSLRRNTPFYGQAMVEFDRGANSRQLIRDLQDKLDEEFHDCRVLVRQLEQGPPFDAPVEVNVFGADLAVLQRLGNEIRLIMSGIPDVVHTRSDLSEMVPKLALNLDEYEARTSGLTHREIENQLYASLEGLRSGTLVAGTEDVPIRVRTTGTTRQNLGDIASFEIKSPHHREGFPLSAIADLRLESEVAAIPRTNGRRLNEIKTYITAGTLPDLVISEFKERLEKSDFTLPVGYTIEYGGESAQRNEAVSGLMANIPLLIALIIATLVGSFSSFRVAFIISLVGCLSIGLGLGSLWAFGFPFGFMGVVGTMGLVGVAVNDSIVVMAGIRDTPDSKNGVPEAIADVVIRRTRHIVATTLTTIAGFTPLVLGGGNFWPPVAITIAGGVGGATLLALCFVPSIYLILIGRSTPLNQNEPENAPSE